MPHMCEVTATGDTVVFSAPPLELSVAYLTARNVAEVKLADGTLYITPAVGGLVDTLKAICNSEVSTLLLDLKESLLHLGWLVDGGRDVVRIRKSMRINTDLVVVEYEKAEKKLSLFTTRLCLADFLQRESFQTYIHKYMLEAWKKASLLEAVEFAERLPAC